MTDTATITYAVGGLGACTNPNHIPAPSPIGSSAWTAVQEGALFPRNGRKEWAEKGGERTISPCFHKLALQQSSVSDILYELKWME